MTIPVNWSDTPRDEIQLLRDSKIRRLGTHRICMERLGYESSSITKLREENEGLTKQIDALNREIEMLRAINSNYKLRNEVIEAAKEKIILACASAYFITPADLMSREKYLPLPWARQLAISCFHETLPFVPIAVVARLFNCNRRGVEYSLQVVRDRLTWPEEKWRIEKVRKLLGLE